MDLKTYDQATREAILAACCANKRFIVKGAGVSCEFAAISVDQSEDFLGAYVSVRLQQVDYPKGDVPTTWRGPEEGLPPIGLEVEVLWNSDKGEYVTGKVLAHDEDRALFRFTSGTRKGEYQADSCFFSKGADQLPTFRRIRTPEQIAAEERAAAVSAMLADAGVTDSAWNDDPETVVWAEALYDAGYRKQVAP